jgi:hypothetical protein
VRERKGQTPPTHPERGEIEREKEKRNKEREIEWERGSK